MDQLLTCNAHNYKPIYLSITPANISQFPLSNANDINLSQIIKKDKVLDINQEHKICNDKIPTNLIPQKIRSNVYTPISTNVYTPIPTFNHMPIVQNIISIPAQQSNPLSQKDKDKNKEYRKNFTAKRKPYNQLATIQNPDEKIAALLIIAYPEFSTLPKYTLLQEIDTFIKSIRSRYNA